jgi:phosphonate transport system substrate-binding protein
LGPIGNLIVLTRRSILLAGASLATASQAQTGAMRLAVVPQFPALELHKAWWPLVESLQSSTGLKLELVLPGSIPAFEEGFLQGQWDLAFMNPYHAVMAHRAQGYKPLVRDDDALSGLLVVRADSSVRQVSELMDRNIAFPAPNAFGASLYMRALLTEKHGLRFTPQYLKTHSNAYRAVAAGTAIAAGGVRATFEAEPAELKAQLRVLFETPATPSHPLCAHPRVGEATHKQITQALLVMTKSEVGRKLLQAAQLERIVTADYRRDYAPLEGLGLDKYVQRS